MSWPSIVNQLGLPVWEGQVDTEEKQAPQDLQTLESNNSSVECKENLDDTDSSFDLIGLSDVLSYVLGFLHLREILRAQSISRSVKQQADASVTGLLEHKQDGLDSADLLQLLSTKCKRLESLEICVYRTTMHMVDMADMVYRLENLRKLVLWTSDTTLGFGPIAETLIPSIASHLPKLEKLHLDNLFAMSQVDATPLARLQNLKNFSIIIDFHHPTVQELIGLVDIINACQLEELRVCKCFNFFKVLSDCDADQLGKMRSLALLFDPTLEEFHQILADFPSLTSLDVGIHRIEEELGILGSLKELDRLVLDSYARPTSDMLEYLLYLKSSPKLHFLGFRYIDTDVNGVGDMDKIYAARPSLIISHVNGDIIYDDDDGYFWRYEIRF